MDISSISKSPLEFEITRVDCNWLEFLDFWSVKYDLPGADTIFLTKGFRFRSISQSDMVYAVRWQNFEYPNTVKPVLSKHLGKSQNMVA